MNGKYNIDKIQKALHSELKKAKTRADGWANAITGLGKSRDKKKNTYFGEYTYLDDDELTRTYVGDGFAAKIINVVAEDMTRRWIHLKGRDDEFNRIVMKQLTALDSEKTFNEAVRWQRLFGGSVVVMGVMDGNKIDKPLDIEKATAVEWLKVYDRSDIEITQSTFNTDPMSPDFGEVETYWIRNPIRGTETGLANFRVHASRTLEFFGDPVPRRIQGTHNDVRYWGVSALQSIWEQLRDTGGTMGGIATMMYELIVGVYKFEGLSDMLATGNESQLVNRMEIIDMTKSVINAVLLDSDESFERNSVSLAGVADIIDRIFMSLSGTSGIPVTRLFGRSPAGQNATGESDSDNYNALVEAKQKNDLKAPLQELVTILSAIEGVDEPEDVPEVVFNPLDTMDEKEEAEIRKADAATAKSNAETDKIYVELGVLDSDDVETIRGFDVVEEELEE